MKLLTRQQTGTCCSLGYLWCISWTTLLGAHGGSWSCTCLRFWPCLWCEVDLIVVRLWWQPCSIAVLGACKYGLHLCLSSPGTSFCLLPWWWDVMLIQMWGRLHSVVPNENITWHVGRWSASWCSRTGSSGICTTGEALLTTIGLCGHARWDACYRFCPSYSSHWSALCRLADTCPTDLLTSWM